MERILIITLLVIALAICLSLSIQDKWLDGPGPPINNITKAEPSGSPDSFNFCSTSTLFRDGPAGGIGETLTPIYV